MSANNHVIYCAALLLESAYGLACCLTDLANNIIVLISLYKI